MLVSVRSSAVSHVINDNSISSDTIIHELKKNPELTNKLMSDVTYQSADNLVDGKNTKMFACAENVFLPKRSQQVLFVFFFYWF